MTHVAWHFPTRILFGEGCVREVGTEARALGAKRALLVSDPGVAKASLLDPVEEALATAGLEHARFTEISSNPTEAEVMAATVAYADSEADILIGVGGGAALDVAKLVRITATQTLPLAEYDDAKGGDAKMKGAFPPMLAIPTTAGTGSEVGRSGVATLESTGLKTVFFHADLIPNAALLDPVMTVSLPVQVTAATGFDALSHNLEAYCAKGVHPIADAIALEGISLVSQHLRTAVEDGHDLVARGGMLQAATMGAIAFQKGLGVCHSLAHPLGSEHGIHHGLANALCMPAALDFNRTKAQERVAEIARRLGARGDDVETLAFECAGAIRALRRDCGLPGSLAEVGVQEEHLPHLADLAVKDGCHQLNPRACTREDMLSLYRASL